LAKVTLVVRAVGLKLASELIEESVRNVRMEDDEGGGGGAGYYSTIYMYYFSMLKGAQA
jgi:hypothetical protein